MRHEILICNSKLQKADGTVLFYADGKWVPWGRWRTPQRLRDNIYNTSPYFLWLRDATSAVYTPVNTSATTDESGFTTGHPGNVGAPGQS